MDQREPIELPVERISNAPASDAARPLVFQFRFGNLNLTASQPPLRPVRRRRLLPLLLFFATCLSTFFVGSQMFGRSRLVMSSIPGATPRIEIEVASMLLGGLQYSLGLMAILMAHEMGHFLQAQRYKVPASWPWFIPMTIFGLRDSQIIDMNVFGGGFSFGNPPLLTWLAEWHFGRSLLPNEDVVMTPFLHAGWVGILVTALNLMPIGQLDGGHILYGLIGRKAHRVAVIVLWTAVFWMFRTGNWSYSPIVFLMLITGARHPPTRDDSVPLGRVRVVLGWLTLAFVLIGFTPNPISIDDRVPQHPQLNVKPETVFVWRYPENPEPMQDR